MLAYGQLFDVQLVVDFNGPYKAGKLSDSIFCNPYMSLFDSLQMLRCVGYIAIGQPGQCRIQTKQFGGRAFDGGESGRVCGPGGANEKCHAGTADGCDLGKLRKIAAFNEVYKGFRYNST